MEKMTYVYVGIVWMATLLAMFLVAWMYFSTTPEAVDCREACDQQGAVLMEVHYSRAAGWTCVCASMDEIYD